MTSGGERSGSAANGWVVAVLAVAGCLVLAALVWLSVKGIARMVAPEKAGGVSAAAVGKGTSATAKQAGVGEPFVIGDGKTAPYTKPAGISVARDMGGTPELRVDAFPAEKKAK